MSYRVDHARKRITVLANGEVTMKDLLDYAQARVTAGAASYDQIFDARGAALMISAPEIDQLVAASVKAHAGAPFGRAAIVADEDAAYNLARMSELFSARAGIISRAFHTVEDAEVWLSTSPV